MKYLGLFAICWLPYLLQAQLAGAITYQETVQLSFEIPEGMEEMFAKMPKERSSDKTLYFEDSKAIYINAEDKIGNEDNHYSASEGGMQIEFKMEEPDNRFYTDLKSGKVKNKQEFMGKSFLISTTPKKYDWKIGRERQKVMDYVCMNASAQLNDSTSVVAWFTTDIPVSIGPGPYNGLPGLILALEYNGDERTIVATDVQLGDFDASVIEEPTKGKKVSQEEFEKIRDEKLKEMNAMRGKGGVQIITRHN